jgi:nucleoid-associated protein YgaU
MSNSRRKLHRQVRRSTENRRRIQATLCIAFLISVCIFTFYLDKADVRASSNWTEPVEVLIIQGDSLWSIAKSIPGAENVDIRKVIYEIKKLNGLSSSYLIPGQTLVIPREFK